MPFSDPEALHQAAVMAVIPMGTQELTTLVKSSERCAKWHANNDQAKARMTHPDGGTNRPVAQKSPPKMALKTLSQYKLPNQCDGDQTPVKSFPNVKARYVWLPRVYAPTIETHCALTPKCSPRSVPQIARSFAIATP